MKKRDGLNVGWIDTSIGALLQRDAQLPQCFRLMLVTSIDSSRDLSQMREAQEIVRRYAGCRLLGTGLVVPSDRAAEVIAAFKLFTGFDEVWWFDEEPSLAKPEELSLVGPLNLATDEIPAGLTQWMQDSKCRLGLGDGIGLNFVTPDVEVAERLKVAATV